MGTGASNQVRSEDVEDISAANCSDSGKNRPFFSSSNMILKSNQRKESKSKNSKEVEEKDTNLSTDRSKALAEFKSKRKNVVNKDIPKIHRSTVKTPVRAANISQLSPIDSSKIKNEPSVAKLSPDELMDKLKQIELQLAQSESQRLDAMDQLQTLEEKLKSPELQTSSQEDSDMSETIHAKDQLIVKLEKDLKTSESEAKTTRMKLKRRIKALTSRLQEVRQESSIGQMELKGEITQLKEQLRSRSASADGSKLEVATPRSSHESQSKLIIELSNQMTEQSERINVLENQLIERDAHIQSLKSSKTDESVHDSATGDRLRSGRGSRIHRPSAVSRDNPRESSLQINGVLNSDLQSSYSRQSTALSDSDSDWGMDNVRPQTHSAPARSRVKSAVAKKPIAKVGGMHGDDDSLKQYLGTVSSDNIPPRDANTSEGCTRPHKKSALRNHLEKRKNENQTNSLMGPSLAFSPPGQEPPDETLSCDPTPRYKDNPARLPGFSNLTVVNAVNN